MKKLRYLIITLLMMLAIFMIPNISKAEVEVKKERIANDGSVKYTFTGLELDKTHEYKFGLTKAVAAEIKTWYSISEWTDTTIIVNISGAVEDFTNVITAVDTGYITIKDKTTDTVVLEPYGVDLTIPYLSISNYQVLNNGKELGYRDIGISMWNSRHCDAYYQYEKITDETVIKKYKEIKSENGKYTDLQSILKTTAPIENWKQWEQWHYDNAGHTNDHGIGRPEKTINVPDNGLYYMWIYLAGRDVKNLYGYILVDNLAPEIALDSITLPKTAEVELGKTLKLTPGFSPENTTNKIVKWTSSDETVATVDNAGNITPKKIGSTIITVASQDDKKKATCTVTVINEKIENNTNPDTSNQNNKENQNQTNNGNTNNNSGENTNNVNQVAGKRNDQTTAKGTLPKTGVGIELIIAIISMLGIGIVVFLKYNRLRMDFRHIDTKNKKR